MALGALDIIIAADTAQLRKGMDTAVGIMQSSTKTMESAAKTAAGAIAGYFTFDAIKGSIQHTLDFADSLSKMSQKVGVSVDALYAMQAAGKLADVDLQTLEKSLLKFNKGLGTASMGSGDTANALKNLGISLKDSSGHLKMSDQYLLEVADKFKAMPDGIAKSTLAMQLFGKSGADMIPLLNGGSEALKEFSGIMDKDSAQAAERLNDSFTRMGLAFEGNKTQILTGMLPAIESLSGSFEDFAVWMSNHKDDVTAFTNQAGNDLTALGMVGHDAFNLISDTSIDMLKAVNSVFSAIPNMIGESSNDSINNFGFFEYFILGLSTATNAVKQFIANGKMAYATAAEMQAKYGSVGGLITNGGSRAAEARYDYAVAKSEAEQATKNVSETYNTLLGLKKQFVAKSTEIKTPPFVPGLEDYAKNDSAAKKLESDKQKEIKIQNGYLDYFADLEAKNALEDYNNKISYLNYYSDLEAKAALDQYNLEIAYIDDLAARQASAAVAIFGATQTEAEKINELYLDIFNTSGHLFSQEELTPFFDKWNLELDGIKSKMDFSANIEFDPSMMEGMQKGLAGVMKSMKLLEKEEKQYNKNKTLYAKDSIEYAQNEEAHTENQIAGYSNLAGAASAMFEQGSKEAQLMITIQSGLAMVNAVSGIAKQASLPFPYNIAAMASTAATVFSFLSSAGISGGGGSSASATPPPDASMGTVLGGGAYGQSESITNITDLLDSIHVSEYAELRDINRAVTSMAQGIEGAVTNLFRSGATDTSGLKLAGNGLDNSIANLLTTNAMATIFNPLEWGNLAKALFGSSTRQELRASGLDINAGSLASKQSGAGLGASSYIDIETVKRKAWGSTSYSYSKTNTDLDEATSNSISLIYKSFDDTMKSINKGLGTHLEQTINDYQFEAVSLNLKGLTGEEATKKLSDMFSAQGDRMVTDIFGNIINQYQKLGEGLLESAVRVITEKEIVLQDLGDIGQTISGDVLGISQSLITLSGSLSDFQDNNASYYEKYFTDAEKQANTQKHLAEAFNKMNIVMPSTVEGFRSTVEALDLSTLSGREAYVSLMQISGAFYDVSVKSDDALIIVKDSIKEFTTESENLANTLKNASKSMESFLTGLLDADTNVAYLADSLGVNVATSVAELLAMSTQLALDTDGLTEADKALINANKNLLITQRDLENKTNDVSTAMNKQKDDLDKYLSTVTGNISTLEGTLSSLRGAIDSLRGSAIGSSYTLDMYQRSMSETLALSKGNEYQKFSESLSKTIGYSSALNDSSLYATSQDMAFAQAVAANQFESMETTAVTQIDYLSMIEENTRASVGLLADQLKSLGTTISASDQINREFIESIAGTNSTAGIIEAIKKISAPAVVAPPSTLEQWTKTKEGSDQFISTGGAVAVGDSTNPALQVITDKIGASYTTLDAMTWIKQQLEAGNPMGVYNEAVKRGISSNAIDGMMGWAAGTSMSWVRQYNADNNAHLPAFLNGTTSVPYDMTANIHRGEIIVPPTFSNGLRNGDLMMGNNNELIAEIKKLNNLTQQQANEIKAMRKELQTHTSVLAQIEENVA